MRMPGLKFGALRQIVPGNVSPVRHILALAVLAALGAAAFALPWAEVWNALQATQLTYLMLAVALTLAVFPLWVWQWRMIVAPVKPAAWRMMCGVVALSVAAKATVSGMAGVSVGLLALKVRAGLSYSEAGSVISVDQFFALATKLAVMLLAVALLPLPTMLHGTLLGLLALGTGMLVLLVFADRAGRWLGFLPLSGVTPLRAALGHLQRFLADLGRVASRRVLAGGMALAFAKRALEVAAAFAVQMACGLGADPVAPVLVVAAVSLTTLVPLTPANLGTHSAGVFGAYVLVGVPAELALAAGLLHHAVVLFSSMVLAVLGLGLSRAPHPSPAP